MLKKKKKKKSAGRLVVLDFDKQLIRSTLKNFLQPHNWIIILNNDPKGMTP